MSLEADHILDRRSLRRKLTMWRVLSIAALVALVIGGALAVSGKTALFGAVNTQHIARIEISGVITGAKPQLDLIERVKNAAHVKGVIISINSPGGSVSGSDALYQALRDLAAQKPMVSFIDGVGASGGYIAALASDHIVARQTSITGSIGVVAQVPNVSGLLGKLGVEVETSRSAPLKMMPSGVEPTTAAGKAAMQALIDDQFQWFKALVKERRSLSDEQVSAASDGRAFTGRLALPLKLIDKVGDEKQAKAYLTDKIGGPDLNIITWRPREDDTLSNLRRFSGTILEMVGYPDLALALTSTNKISSLNWFDGPLALWQPSSP